jgi:hypothetical protein
MSKTDEDRTLMLGTIASLEGRFTQLVSTLRGAVVNDVLYSGQVVLDANGVATIDFETPCGSISVGNHSNAVIVVADGGTQANAPSNGPGVFTVGASAGETINHATREFTIYGTPGAVVTVQVFTRPQPPGRGLVRAAAGLGTTAASSADAQPGNAVETTNAAKIYGFNGATWDRLKASSPIDAFAAVIGTLLTQAFGMAYNGATWDRIRNAAGAASDGSVSTAQVVAIGTHALTSLNAAATAVAGTALSTLLAHRDWTMQVTGTAVGQSVNFEVSLDGTTWVAVTPTAVPGGGGTVVGSAATTNGIYTISVATTRVRARLTAITSGNTTAIVTGI